MFASKLMWLNPAMSTTQGDADCLVVDGSSVPELKPESPEAKGWSEVVSSERWDEFHKFYIVLHPQLWCVTFFKRCSKDVDLSKNIAIAKCLKGFLGNRAECRSLLLLMMRHLLPQLAQLSESLGLRRRPASRWWTGRFQGKETEKTKIWKQRYRSSSQRFFEESYLCAEAYLRNIVKISNKQTFLLLRLDALGFGPNNFSCFEPLRKPLCRATQICHSYKRGHVTSLVMWQAVRLKQMQNGVIWPNSRAGGSVGFSGLVWWIPYKGLAFEGNLCGFNQFFACFGNPWIGCIVGLTVTSVSMCWILLGLCVSPKHIGKG